MVCAYPIISLLFGSAMDKPWRRGRSSGVKSADHQQILQVLQLLEMSHPARNWTLGLRQKSRRNIWPPSGTPCWWVLVLVPQPSDFPSMVHLLHLALSSVIYPPKCPSQVKKNSSALGISMNGIGILATLNHIKFSLNHILNPNLDGKHMFPTKSDQWPPRNSEPPKKYQCLVLYDIQRPEMT